jgi:multidrug transporter EmrE-like cation transporter
MSPFIFIAISSICGICGQLSLKYGMMRIASGQPGGSPLVRALTSPWVIGGLAVYATGVLFWLLALSRLEITYVYPFASLAYVGIVIGSYLLFKEQMNRLRLLGIAIVIIGVLVTGLS